ncbi:MAG: phenylalanine--tRNA ligase subunit beta, partial [Nanoarchaeota archaeon]
KVKKVRPAVACAVIKNINMDDATIKSIMDMQDKLTLTHGRNRKKVAIGIHDADTITFPLTYTTKPRNFEFTPLEGKKPYTLNQILELHPKGREFGDIIKQYSEFPIWIDKRGQVLSMPPIINAEETKITSSTKNLFIDITGTDQQAVEQALNIIVANCADRGGKIYKVNNFPDMNPKKIKINLQEINKRLGISISAQQAKKLLERMGMTLQGTTVLYPAYRTDILHPIDILEDIAISYGYENFTPTIPRVATIAEEDTFEKMKNKLMELLIGLGITEVSTYHLVNKESQTTYMRSKNECVAIMNPKSAEYNVLRNQMLPSLLEVLKNNKQYEYPQKIGESGVVFIKNKEEAHLAIAIADTTANFTQMRQIIDAIISSLKLKVTIKEKDHPSFITGRTAAWIMNNKEIAVFGEMHPEVLSNFQLETPVAACELNLSELKRICKE